MADASVIETQAEGVTAVFNGEALASRFDKDPDWLIERRRHAWSVYETTPMPSTRLEEWRYTHLGEKLDLSGLRFGASDPVPDDRYAWPEMLTAAMDEDREASGHLVIVDGSVTYTDIDQGLAGQGVILMPLREAVEKHPEMLQEYLATQAVPPEEGKFPALNAAFWSDGIFLYVPRNVQLELPIRVTRWLSESGVAVFTRTLIVAEPGSQVSYVDECLSEDLHGQSLASSAVEVIARDEAQVQYVAVQRLGRGAFYQAAQRTLAGQDSTLDTLNVNLGATTSRVDLNASLLGPGANCNMLGLYFGDDDQHFDHNTSQDHVAPHTSSDLLYKGALDGASRAAFRGIIRVHKGAQQTDAYQTNRNLLLSDRARADSLPNLEIEADDVKCSHGATVGQLDRESLFYLMSRGLERAQAERLVVMGFLGEVLSRLPLGGVAEKVTKVIEEKLGHI